MQVESLESKVYDDIQKIIDHALNKDELTQDIKKSVSDNLNETNFYPLIHPFLNIIYND